MFIHGLNGLAEASIFLVFPPLTLKWSVNVTLNFLELHFLNFQISFRISVCSDIPSVIEEGRLFASLSTRKSFVKLTYTC